MKRNKAVPVTARLDPDWVKPYWLERQQDPRSPAFVARAGALPGNVTARNWTTIGTVASEERALVDPRGLLTPRGASWSVDWWVGAEDRWHLPSREAAVRQQLVGESPVVETAMRIPGGDAIQRAYAVPDGLAVVEITNATPTPIALGVALRPYGPTGLSGISRISLDDRTATVDGRPALGFPRGPLRVVTSIRRDGDAVRRLLLEEFDTEATREVRCPDGQATAVYLFPLAHRQTLRFFVRLAPGPSPGTLDALPDSDAVVRSWQAQTSSRGARFVLPEGRLASALEANRRFLLLLGGDSGVATTMDRYGFHKDSAAVLSTIPGRPAGGGDVGALAAMAEHWRLTASLDAVDGETVVRLVRALQRSGGAVQALVDGAVLLRAFGLDQVADECDRAVTSRRAAASGGDTADETLGPAVVDVTGGNGLDVHRTLQLAAAEVDAGDRAALERLSWLLDMASPTWTWPTVVHPQLGTGSGGEGHDGAVAAGFLSLVRRMLVREAGDADLALCSMLPDAWTGQNFEVHGAPTRFGSVSFAVRYHGDRPALLWELDIRPGIGVVRLRAPGLDPSWSTTEAKGEALLSAPPPAAAPGASEGSEPGAAIAVEGSFS